VSHGQHASQTGEVPSLIPDVFLMPHSSYWACQTSWFEPGRACAAAGHGPQGCKPSSSATSAIWLCSLAYPW